MLLSSKPEWCYGWPKRNSLNLVCRLITRLAVASIMIAQLTSSVPSIMTGINLSKYACTYRCYLTIFAPWTSQRNKIRDWDPKYLVIANMWPWFLYEEHTYDPNEPTKGLFKGPMLIQVSMLVPTEIPLADLMHDRPSKPFSCPQVPPMMKNPTLPSLINSAMVKGTHERTWLAWLWCSQLSQGRLHTWWYK